MDIFETEQVVEIESLTPVSVDMVVWTCGRGHKNASYQKGLSQ